MKKLMLSLIAVAMTAGLVEAQTNVLSQNAVGYVKVTVPSNGLFLASVPFNSLDSISYPIPQIFGSQLTGGANFGLSDNLLKFDSFNQIYIRFWKNTSGQWRQFPQAVETTNTLSPGEAFWIVSKQPSNQVVYIMGEVPDKDTAPSANINLSPGLQFASYAYPAEVGINETTIISNAHRGANFGLSDNILKWDPINKIYIRYWLPLGTNEWRRFPQGTPTSDKFAPGEGMFYLSRGTNVTGWSELKPYTWP